MKNGHFEEWLIQASVKEIESSFVKDVTIGGNLELNANRSFLRNFSWPQQLQFYEDLKKITKKQMVDFLNRIYKNNYVVAYKTIGNTDGFTKIEKPKITTPFPNDDKQSSFVKNFKKSQPHVIVPEFSNYDKSIQKKVLSTGNFFYSTKNITNNLFNLDIVFDIGKEHNAQYAFAIDFMKMTGTNRYTNEELKKEFYRYNINFTVSVNNRRTVLHLDGPNESFAKGIELVSHLIDNSTPDQQLYDNYIQNILTTRIRSKSDRTQIRHSLGSFALYGETSPLRDIFPESEMKKTTPLQLKDIIASLKKYRHTVLYEGQDADKAIKIFSEKFIVKKPLKEYEDKRKYSFTKSSPVVYFTQFQGAQAEILVLKPMKKFQTQDLPFIYMLNRFIEKLAYNEIREKRALAYQTYAACYAAADTTQQHQMEIYAGVQMDKTIETIVLIDSVFKNLEKFKTIFEIAKADQLKRHELERRMGSSLLFSYLDSQKWGIKEDPMKAVYSGITKMTFEDLISFYQKEMAFGGFSYTIVGDSNIIDLKKLEQFGNVKEIGVEQLFNY